MQYAAMHESGSGKKPTKRQGSMTSVVRGRPAVAGRPSNRRDWSEWDIGL